MTNFIKIKFKVQTSFGYSVTFEEWGTKIDGIPLVCILEPNENDKILTENFVERMMREIRLCFGSASALEIRPADD